MLHWRLEWDAAAGTWSARTVASSKSSTKFHMLENSDSSDPVNTIHGILNPAGSWVVPLFNMSTCHISHLSSSSSSQRSLLPLWRRWVVRKRMTAAPGRNRRATSEKHSFSWRPWDRKYHSCSPDRATSRYRLPSPGQRLPSQHWPMSQENGSPWDRHQSPGEGWEPHHCCVVAAGALVHGSRLPSGTEAAPSHPAPWHSSGSALPFPSFPLSPRGSLVKFLLFSCWAHWSAAAARPSKVKGWLWERYYNNKLYI